MCDCPHVWGNGHAVHHQTTEHQATNEADWVTELLSMYVCSWGGCTAAEQRSQGLHSNRLANPVTHSATNLPLKSSGAAAPVLHCFKAGCSLWACNGPKNNCTRTETVADTAQRVSSRCLEWLQGNRQ